MTHHCLEGHHSRCKNSMCGCECHDVGICGNIVGYSNDTPLRCCRVKGHKEGCCEWRADGVSRMDQVPLCVFCNKPFSGHDRTGKSTDSPEHFFYAQESESIDHPAHYGGADNVYEAIKVIDAWQLSFCLGNVLKYIARAGKKNNVIGSTVEDLKKAAWYLQHEIERLERD